MPNPTTTHGAQIDISISAMLAEITRVADRVESFGCDQRIPSHAVNDMNVVLDEVISNIVRYGGESARAHPIEIRLGRTGDRFFAEVRDHGMPFDPVAHVVPAPPRAGQRTPGNLGLLFVRALMDEVRYKRENDSNVLFVAKTAAGLGPLGVPPFGIETTRPDAQSAVVALRGVLVGTTYATLREQLRTLIDSGAVNIVVDLAETARIASSGFWVLFKTRRRLDELGGRLVLCNLQPVVHTLFEIAGFLGEFTFVPDRAAALQELRKPLDPLPA
jgi:anti-anti-sigma factor